MKDKGKVLVVVVVVALAVNLFVGGCMHARLALENGSDEGYQQIRQFGRVLKLIRNHYVDEHKVGYKDLVYAAMQGMLRSLDRFSMFMPPDQYKLMKEETEGEFGGIGVHITPDLTVIAAIEGSPADKAGLQPDDQIVKVNGEEVTKMGTETAVKLIKGRPGTTVELTTFRPATKETRTLKVARAVIELQSVRAAHFCAPGIAYIQVTMYDKKTTEGLEKAVGDLQSEHRIEGLILDLRHNPGGLLESAREASALFLPPDALIVATVERQETEREEHRSGSGQKFLEFPMVLLINEASASGAEIMAGCLQDNGRATLVGEKTFGKFSVQQIHELPDGSAVKLTIARYYTPRRWERHLEQLKTPSAADKGQKKEGENGEVAEKGIDPDVAVAITREESERLNMQRSRPKGARLANPDKDLPDKQLAQAIEVLKRQQPAPGKRP